MSPCTAFTTMFAVCGDVRALATKLLLSASIWTNDPAMVDVLRHDLYA